MYQEIDTNQGQGSAFTMVKSSVEECRVLDTGKTDKGQKGTTKSEMTGLCYFKKEWTRLKNKLLTLVE